MKPSRKKTSRAASRMRRREIAFFSSRRPALAGSDSDVVAPLVAVGLEELGLDVALAEARDDGDDAPELRAVARGVLERRRDRRARRDAAEDALLPRHAPRHLERLVVGHGDDAVEE